MAGKLSRLGKTDAWLLLRTNGRGTLALAKSLTDDGIEAWTPSIVTRKRIARSRSQRDARVALIPTFVFARSKHLERLLELAHRPGRHNAFSLFRFLGSIPLFTDAALDPLRVAEARTPSRSRRRVYRPGQMVRVPEGSFAGMTGIVERSDGRYTVVAFGGAIRVKIATFLLLDDMSQDPLSAGADTNIAA